MNCHLKILKINLSLLLLSLCFLLPQFNFAQDKKPKVALVLSGGGAKGIAHIRILQVLDSLNIVPDLIVGTSMGSVIGGLYAMGYSGDSIANITKNANWDRLLGGGASLNKVSVEEKSEFNRYLIELELKEGKINTGSYLINDQNLREFISLISYTTYKIGSFDDLSIPFRAVTTDILNGKEVILDRGSLSFAMRASMSIPGVFSPVPYENTLLVDGGILNNFPVDIAKKMGADIIIGSDVGGNPNTKESLNSISKLLFEASMITSNLKRPLNQKLCNILIDHSPNLTYTSGDFFKTDAIYEEGKIATEQNIDALVTLANKLKKFEQRIHKLPTIKNEFILDTIVYKNISKTNLALVKARTNIRAHKKYTSQEIANGIQAAIGTTIFREINFALMRDNDKLGLELKAFEKSKHQFKGSLHYDGYRGAGLIVNYTGRNILGAASRSLITLDIAEQPKIRLQHQKSFGGDRDWWWRTEILGQQLKQKVFIEGENVDNVKLQYVGFDNEINRNLSSLKSYAGLGVKYEFNGLRPVIDPEFNENILSLEKYNFESYEVYAQYRYNSLNDVFYPTEGTQIQVNLSRVVKNNIKVEYSDPTFENIDMSANDHTKLSLGFEERFPIADRLTGILSANSGFIFEDATSGNDLLFSAFGYGAKYFLGGNVLDPRGSHYEFPALTESELAVSQFIRLGLGLQINTIHKLYFTPHIDVASVGFGNFNDYIKDFFSANGKWQNYNDTNFLASVGTMVSYKSLLGPVNFDVSWVNGTNKFRFFIGIGIPLNRSN